MRMKKVIRAICCNRVEQLILNNDEGVFLDLSIQNEHIIYYIKETAKSEIAFHPLQEQISYVGFT